MSSHRAPPPIPHHPKVAEHEVVGLGNEATTRKQAATSLVLVLTGPEHQVLDRFSRVLALVENQLHLLGDGHLDAVPSRQA